MMNNSDAMHAIQQLLDGKQWSADTIEDVAAIMREAGYEIGEPDSRTNDEGDEPGDHKESGELPPEAGYILLDSTDGEGEEMAAYLDHLTQAAVGEIMCCGIDSINGIIVRRAGAGTPATEIWATTDRDPSSGFASFCLVYIGEPIGGLQLASEEA